jgi:prepilin-type N-terminal cleavage/methylation domain-containing protein
MKTQSGAASRASERACCGHCSEHVVRCFRRGASSEAGVTLIEIMIAVSLLSLLSVGMLVAMRLGFTTMEKTDARLIANRRVANSRQLIENEIGGFMYSVAYFHPRPDETRQVVFLQAQPQRMRFLTSYSIDAAFRGRPQIAVMQVIPGEKEGVRLIVNEIPYTGPDQAGRQVSAIEQDPATGMQLVHFLPVEPGSQSFVLADRLAYCRFTYLEPRYVPPLQVWRSDWIRQDILPQAVRIEMAPLDSKPGDLRIGTVTVPVVLTRRVGAYYADFTPATPQ